jgi:hypothetical protein
VTDEGLISAKLCRKCGATKAVADFYACKRYKDGLRTACKACEKAVALRWRCENGDKVRQSKRAWDKKNKEHVLDYSKRYKDEHREQIRVKARAAAEVYRRENLEAVRARNLAYKRANAEKNRESAREWARNNAEKNRLRARIWAEQNNARLMANIAAYNRRHPELKIRRVQERRIAFRAATMEWGEEFFISEIYDLARKRTEITGQQWQVDHIVPIKSKLVCGLHVYWNLAVIPAQLNRRKSNLRWPDMP